MAKPHIINAPLLVHGHNKFPIYLYGEGNGSIIKTISTAADDTIIKIKGSASNEKHNISNLSFVATNADGQSCFKCTYDKTETDHWDGNAPFRIKNCSMFCKGYNVDYTDCQWSGNSYIKECNCRGGGLIKVKVDPTKYWAGGAYPHAFSNLVIEDIHFSAIGGWPKDSLMYLEGCQNSYFKNITLEGDAKDFDRNVKFETSGRGSYLHISGGSITFDTFWAECRQNNIKEAYDFSLKSISVARKFLNR